MIKAITVGQEVVELRTDYSPLEDESAAYMNVMQLAYFKNVLLEQAEKISSEFEGALDQISSHNVDIHSTDEADMGNIHEELITELRHKDRARKYLQRINDTIKKIDHGTYGYCEQTGEEIGLTRLLLRPITRYCVAAQEEFERKEKAIESAIYNQRDLLDSDYIDKEIE